MSNYIKNIPVFLYPCAYLFLIVLVMFIGKYKEVVEKVPNSIGAFIFWGLIFGFNIYCLVRAIKNSAQTINGQIDLKDMAKLNMMIKIAHIPAFVFNFLLGVIGALLGIWGLGFLLIAVFADLFTIITTGISAIGLNVRLPKERVTGGGRALLYGILNFVYCADVIVAIKEYRLVKAQRQNYPNI